MLRAKLVSYRVVNRPGLNPVWRITNPEDVVEVGDKVFVKLNPANTGLRSLACADRDDEAVKVARSLSVGTGLKEIMRLRNRAQSTALTAVEAETTCSLFETPFCKEEQGDAQELKKPTAGDAKSSRELDHYVGHGR